MERYMELTYLHFTGSALSREDISVTSRIVETWQQAGELEEYQLAQSEYDRSHAAGAAYENAMMNAVKQGDVEAIKTLLSGPSPDYDAIGLGRTYLSRLFHRSEGVTVQQYIQREKCRHAARMLQYSEYTISQIDQYFGFSSQSYFGACFQTWYGMTPNAYRKANR